MRNMRFVPLVLCVALAGAGRSQADEASLAEDTAQRVESRAEALRPDRDQLKWQEIPWMTSLAQALEVAKQEGRPVFLWGSDDEPLERC